MFQPAAGSCCMSSFSSFQRVLQNIHVLKIGDSAHDILGKGMRYGAHELRMARLAIDNALKDVIPLDANGHEQELRRQLANLSWTESPLLTQLLLGRAPVVRQNPHEIIKGDLEAKFDVKVQATVVVVIDVPENIGAVSWMLKVGAQMCSMIPSMQSERRKEGLVVAEGALKAREAVFEDVFRAWVCPWHPAQGTFCRSGRAAMEPTSCRVRA